MTSGYGPPCGLSELQRLRAIDAADRTASGEPQPIHPDTKMSVLSAENGHYIILTARIRK